MSKIFIYFANGVYQIWNLMNNVKISEGKIAPFVKQFSAININLIAFLDIKESKLQALDTQTQKLDSKLVLDIPTLAAYPKPERKDVIKMKQTVEHYTEMVSLPNSSLLVLCEERTNQQTKQFEYVITVINKDTLPTFHAQYVYSSGASTQYRCQIKGINRRDTIVLWPNAVCDSNITFLVWNVLNKEKGCLQLSFKENIFASIVSATSWGSNKIAFWINPSLSNKPEIRILNTKEGNDFKGVIDCFEEEDWMLTDVPYIDTEKNFAVIKKFSSNNRDSIDIISLGKFKHTWNYEPLNANYQFSFPADGSKYFIEYYNQQSEESQENPEEVMNGSNSIVKLRLHTFESYIANPKARALFLMEKSQIIQRYGVYITKRVISILYSNKKKK